MMWQGIYEIHYPYLHMMTIDIIIIFTYKYYIIDRINNDVKRVASINIHCVCYYGIQFLVHITLNPFKRGHSIVIIVII